MAGADGVWKVVAESPMGPQEITLELSTEGSSLSGSADTPFGQQDFEGTIDGDELSWRVKLTNPMPMTVDFKAKVEGDTIDGTAKMGLLGKSTFRGTRVS